MISRSEKSLLAQWWWTVDKPLFFSFCLLMIGGIIFSFAGSPSVASRLGLDIFYFVNRHLVFITLSFFTMFYFSTLSIRLVRRLALLVYIIALGLIIFAIMFGVEVKGSKRWVYILGLSIQPSEFLKPAFVILTAWAVSEGGIRKDMPGLYLAFFILPLSIIPLILQPDMGQTLLIALVWASLFFIAGVHEVLIGMLFAFGVLSFGLSYVFFPHVKSRILRFVNPEMGDTFQVDTAFESFLSGGWFGKGPGEGTLKRFLPDSHTDFIFSVVGEEFGIVVCIFIVFLVAFIVMRSLILALKDPSPFVGLSASGLAILFGMQAFINMAVNVQLIPAKGMTLPFISYGGSSVIALSILAGFLLSILRKRPKVDDLN